MNSRILRLADVIRRTGLPRSTLYRRIKEGQFPGQFPLGPRSVGWSEMAVEEWIQQRIAEGNNCNT